MLALAPPPGVRFHDAHALLVDHAGAESNTAVGLARLGFHAAWVSRLGADSAGDRILDALLLAGFDELFEVLRSRPKERASSRPKEREALAERRGSGGLVRRSSHRSCASEGGSGEDTEEAEALARLAAALGPKEIVVRG